MRLCFAEEASLPSQRLELGVPFDGMHRCDTCTPSYMRGDLASGNVRLPRGPCGRPSRRSRCMRTYLAVLVEETSNNIGRYRSRCGRATPLAGEELRRQDVRAEEFAAQLVPADTSIFSATLRCTLLHAHMPPARANNARCKRTVPLVQTGRHEVCSIGWYGPNIQHMLMKDATMQNGARRRWSSSPWHTVAKVINDDK